MPDVVASSRTWIRDPRVKEVLFGREPEKEKKRQGRYVPFHRILSSDIRYYPRALYLRRGEEELAIARRAREGIVLGRRGGSNFHGQRHTRSELRKTGAIRDRLSFTLFVMKSVEKSSNLRIFLHTVNF